MAKKYYECPYCGESVADDTLTCKHCGYHLSQFDIEEIEKKEELKDIHMVDFSGQAGENRGKQWEKIIATFAGHKVLGTRVKSSRFKQLLKILNKIKNEGCDIEIKSGLIPTKDNVGLLVHNGHQLLGIGMKTDYGYPFINPYGALEIYGNKTIEKHKYLYAHAKLATYLDRNFHTIISKLNFFLKEVQRANSENNF